MAEATRTKQAHEVIAGLREAYPEATCELHFTTPLELLVATILSAQCTDERVNQVTAELFKKYRSAADYAEAPQEELTQVPGAARKTANVVLGTAYGLATGVVVDTHVRRLANRMGLTDETDPEKIERDLMALVAQDNWVWFGHAMIWHGRRICHA